MAPLSSRERLILAEWERARVSRVTRADVAQRWGIEKTDKITAALVRKGALRRVGKGIFLLVPLRAQARPSTPSAAAVVAALLSDEPYYLGGLWALTHHRLTLQQFTTRVDAFTARNHQPRTLANAHLRFHRVSSSRIAKASEGASVEGFPVRVSTKEGTLVDLLDERKGGQPVKTRCPSTTRAVHSIAHLHGAGNPTPGAGQRPMARRGE
jgi:predicted transcriptional regulator of viral defense system